MEHSHIELKVLDLIVGHIFSGLVYFVHLVIYQAEKYFFITEIQQNLPGYIHVSLVAT